MNRPSLLLTARFGRLLLVPLLGLAALAVLPASAQPRAEGGAAGRAPALDPHLHTIFIASDSTAATTTSGPIQGWGKPFADYFDPGKVNVFNGARGGRSSRTFITDGSWEQVISRVKPGDFVLIQFGHNDNGAINEEPPGSGRPLRARGTLPGLGDESQEIDNAVTKKHEVVHTYGWYMRKMIDDVKAKNATPILLSLTVRNDWKDGKVERGLGQYGEWTKQLATAEKVPFVDLTNFAADDFEKMGEAAMGRLYQPDRTHANATGADFNAEHVVAGLLALKGLPFAQFLSVKGMAVPAAPADRVMQPAEVAGQRPRMQPPMPADPSLPTLFIIGDSTVHNGLGDGQRLGAAGQWGWGEPIAAYFDPSKINVVNRAVGGLSSRTYLTQGHWDRVMALLKPGDFVIMQFGHNDDGALNNEIPGPLRARGTIKGIGEETKEIDNVLTKKHEVVHSYGWYLRKFIEDARAKGATPIVCSLIPRKQWTADGKIRRNKDDYAGWAQEVAEQEKAPFIDLNRTIADRYDELGHDAVMKLFPQVTPDEHTHPNLAGAKINASFVIAGLKAVKNDPLAPYFSAQAEEVPPASAATQ